MLDPRYHAFVFLVSLDNIASDISELTKGMEVTRKEFECRRDRDSIPLILKDFLKNSEDKHKKLMTDLKTSREAYASVVQYYGENPKTLAPNTFFSLFQRFSTAYKVSPTLKTSSLNT